MDDSAANRAALIAAAAALLLIAQQVAAKATRDAFFLSHHPATDLPAIMIAAAAFAVIVVLAVSKALTHWSPRRAAPILMLANGAAFAAEWWLAGSQPRTASIVVYLHTSGVGAAVISAFWSLINERFDPHTARRVINRITAGATAGGVAGGVAAWLLAGSAGVRGMLLALAGLGVVAALVTAAAAGRGERRETIGAANRPSGFRLLRETRYLRLLALLVMLAAMGEAAVDYVFKASVSERFSSAAALVSFFALFHAAVGALTFGLQTLAVRRSLSTLGLAGTIALLPGAVLIAGVAALAAPILATATALRAASSTVENSLYRSGYELLYTPLPPATKRPTKTLIDVGCDKIGATLGSGVALVAVLAPVAITRSILLGVALAAAAAGLLIARGLHAGYVSALAESLRSGSVHLDEAALLDATTRRTFADTMALDRGVLLAEIEAFRAAEAKQLSPSAATTTGELAPLTGREAGPTDGAARIATEDSADGADTALRAIAALRSGDQRQIRATLRAHQPLPAELVSHTLPLLERDDLLAPALAALRSSAPRVTGQLIDALLSADTPVKIRRRLPRALHGAISQRAVDGLVAGLRDEVFEVRYRCATALLRITSRAPELTVDRNAILAAARAELSAGGEHELADRDEPTAFDRQDQSRRLGRALTGVFTLLALILEREPLHLAFCALGSDDPGMRGTGREYLDNVLPSGLRDALAPHLGDRQLARRAARPHQEVVDELMSSRDSLSLDLDAVRKTLGDLDTAGAAGPEARDRRS